MEALEEPDDTKDWNSMTNTSQQAAKRRPERLTYTVEEAALALGISRGLAYDMVRQGVIPSLRLGQRRVLVPRSSLEALLAPSRGDDTAA